MKTACNKFLCLVLAFLFALPSHVYAQADTTSLDSAHLIAIGKARLLKRLMQWEQDQYDEQKQLHNIEFETNLYKAGINFFAGSAGFVLTNFIIYKFFEKRPMLGAPKVPSAILELSELEILMDSEKLKTFTELRYGTSTVEAKAAIQSRFKGLSSVFDLYDKHVRTEIQYEPNRPAVKITASEFFRWALKEKPVKFGDNPLIKVLQCLGVMGHPEHLFSNALAMTNLLDAIQRYGLDPVRTILFMQPELSVVFVTTDNYAFFKTHMDANGKKGRFVMIMDMYIKGEQIIHHTGTNPDLRTRMDLLESHDTIIRKRLANEKAAVGVELKSLQRRRIMISAGVGIVIAAAMFLLILPMKNDYPLPEKYNVSIQDMFKIIDEDPETYHVMLIENKAFAVQMANFHDYFVGTMRKADSDIKFLNQLAENQKK